MVMSQQPAAASAGDGCRGIRDSSAGASKGGHLRHRQDRCYTGLQCAQYGASKLKQRACMQACGTDTVAAEALTEALAVAVAVAMLPFRHSVMDATELVADVKVAPLPVVMATACAPVGSVQQCQAPKTLHENRWQGEPWPMTLLAMTTCTC